MTCNVVAKKEASLRKKLKFTILFIKPVENSLVVCTIYFRTEEVSSLCLCFPPPPRGSHSFLMTNDFEVDVHAQKDTNKYATGDQTLSRIRNEIQDSLLWAAPIPLWFTTES